MPAVSTSQRNFMGMVRAMQTHHLKSKNLPVGIRDKVKKVAKNMNSQSVEDFASTKSKGLPKHVETDEGYDFSVLSFREYLGVREAFDALTADERNALIERCATEDEEEIKKGAFHRWLGKDENARITDADITRGLASSDPHVRKMANFAKNMRK